MSDLGDLCLPISVTFQNGQSDFHTHFMLWMGSCVEVRKYAGLELYLFSICYSTISYVNNQVQHHECPFRETAWRGKHF